MKVHIVVNVQTYVGILCKCERVCRKLVQTFQYSFSGREWSPIPWMLFQDVISWHLYSFFLAFGYVIFSQIFPTSHSILPVTTCPLLPLSTVLSVVTRYLACKVPLIPLSHGGRQEAGRRRKGSEDRPQRCLFGERPPVGGAGQVTGHHLPRQASHSYQSRVWNEVQFNTVYIRRATTRQIISINLGTIKFVHHFHYKWNKISSNALLSNN